ncbi:MAG: hypothetical protein QNJ31_07820 [Candidatus Caenarcaniphilales bacterium]|nr:hypothetical protein [Candidatus Caenarcaniphilales bacterium]
MSLARRTEKEEVSENFKILVADLTKYLKQQKSILDRVIAGEKVDFEYFSSNIQYIENVIWDHSNGKRKEPGRSRLTEIPFPDNAVILPKHFFDSWVALYDEMINSANEALKDLDPVDDYEQKNRLEWIIEALEGFKIVPRSLISNYCRGKYGDYGVSKFKCVKDKRKENKELTKKG